MDGHNELYWLAGLLEGEGTFLVGPPSAPTTPMLRLEMTDLDVIERVAVTFERTVQRHDLRPGATKRSWSTTIKGAAAVHFMRLIQPVLGARRRARIDEILARPHGDRIRWAHPAPKCSVAECRRPAQKRSLCKRHYDAWWNAVTRGRTTTIVPRAPELPDATLAVPAPGSEAELAWFAGLLEGEGSFANTGGYPTLRVQMCDRDVVERASHVLAAKIWHASDARATQRGWSEVWATAVAGTRAAELMRRLRPLMGERRRQQIDRALAAYSPIRLTAPPATCVVDGCRRMHRSRGLCNTHYMKWSRDLSVGRAPRVTPLR